MPTINNYLNLIYINLAFMSQIALMFYFRSIIDIKKNWSLYRCNPSYWVFSDNISEDFTYCVQNSQINLMGYLLQPITYMMSVLSSISGDFNTNINSMRQMTSGIRGFITSIIENIFGVFLNLVTEFQRMIISIKDMVGKVIGIVVTILYILDGSIKTMSSAWAGPSGQIVRALGSCFHPDTKVKLKNGLIYKMQDLPLGSVLEDGGIVNSVMKINNSEPEYIEELYKIKGGVNNEDIFVTGSHYVFDIIDNKFKPVCEYKYAEKQTTIVSNWYSCLITSTGKIPINKQLFWDWEDDQLTNKIRVL